jgi:hypothetical protein
VDYAFFHGFIDHGNGGAEGLICGFGVRLVVWRARFSAEK